MRQSSTTRSWLTDGTPPPMQTKLRVRRRSAGGSRRPRDAKGGIRLPQVDADRDQLLDPARPTSSYLRGSCRPFDADTLCLYGDKVAFRPSSSPQPSAPDRACLPRDAAALAAKPRTPGPSRTNTARVFRARAGTCASGCRRSTRAARLGPHRGRCNTTGSHSAAVAMSAAGSARVPESTLFTSTTRAPRLRMVSSIHTCSPRARRSRR
jgi:hypothetical protein